MESQLDLHTPWTFAQKLFFRFFTIFFALNLFPFPANMSANADWTDSLPYLIWGTPVQWIAAHLLHIPGELSMEVTGSGDTTFHWIQQGLILVLSLLGAMAWSVIDRNRMAYSGLHVCLRVYLRYFLAFMMFLYGFAKVFYLQMPPPGLYSLVKPYGTFSPMGVLWNFIGASEPYSIFTGMAEILGGVLLLFRRTVLLGALVSFGVMLHVFVLNMCYDVPVKIFSFLLVLLAVFLAAPDAKRLFDFFVSQKNAVSAPDRPLFFQIKWPKLSLLLKWAIVVWMFYANMSYYLEARKTFGKYAPRPPLCGIYEVQSFEKNNVAMPLTWTDSTLWRKIIVHDYFAGRAVFIMANDSIKSWVFEADTLAHQIKMHPRRDTTTAIFTYVQQVPDVLLLKGIWQKDSLSVQLRRFDERKFLLMNRGFHWVNEYPFNR